MSVGVGTRLGSLEITALLGKGGMGEVYRARDTRLGRDVAIKTLPEEFTSNPDRLARFQREAKLLASLNHPNIGAIYGLEEFNGAPVLILELVEGETLAERLKLGAIAAEEALKIAVGIADALEEAHEKGVIHRDLKPGNIKITPDGKVKVLDFGLAKALEGNEASLVLSNSPTLSNAATLQGVILGTAAYMSPEQAKGRATMRAADIWAFGCVLYEMLSGRPVFDGEDVSEILASVIKGTTNLDLLPANLHPTARRVIQRCLEKDVKKRFRDIGDVRNELAEVLTDPSGVLFSPALEAVHPVSKPIWPWIAAMLVVAIVAGSAGWLLRTAPPSEPRQVHRFDYELPAGREFGNDGRRLIALSPDGSRFVYAATGGLYVRSMDTAEARLIEATAGVQLSQSQPFFSPDGQWIGFWSLGELKKIHIGGGPPVTLCAATSPFGVTWTADNNIVYGQRDGIWRISGNGGGMPERIVEAEKDEQVDSPQVLPGGEWVLFTSTTFSGPTRWDQAALVAVSLKSRQRKPLWRGGSDGHYIPTGHLVYALGDALYAVPFDLTKLEVTGGQVPVIDGVRRMGNPGGDSNVAHFAFSERGTLIYIPGGVVTKDRILALVDRKGAVQRLGLPPKAYLNPRFSPDGKRILLQTEEGKGNLVWVYDLSGTSDIRQLTLSGNSQRPLWTPDGRRVSFASDREGTMSIYWQDVDGNGAAERLTTAEKGTEHWPESWSRNGRTLSFAIVHGTESAVWTLSADTHMTRVFASEPGKTLRGSAFSPDGGWIAYHSNESGANAIYVQPFPDGPKMRITQNRARANPVWSSLGRELFYRNAGIVERQLLLRPVSFKDGVTFGPEQALPLPQYLTFGNGYRDYDIAPDAEHFLMIFPANPVTESRPQISVVLNWLEELKQRVPVK
jgi:serine/threonine protein kinase/Tol biopolymer transport system component